MPTLTRARGGRVLALTASLGALALGATACGSSSNTDADPAQAVPASAPIYAQVTVKPDGQLKTDTESVLKKLGVNDPSHDITQFLKDNAGDPASVDDVMSAIGSRVGVFVTSFTGNADAAVVAATSDAGKAKDAIQKDAGRKASYKDVDYWFDKKDATSVAGVVGDYVVTGTERAFRTVVDTVKDGGDTIADNSDYQDGLKALGTDDALGTAYVSTEGVLNALGRSGGIPAAQLGQIRQQLAQVGGSSTVVKLAPSSDSITLEVATLGLKQGSSTSDAATTALTGLPGDAWLGVGLPHIGDTLGQALQQGMQAAATAGQNLDSQLQGLQQALGIDIQGDLLSWMGDGGLFASGANVTQIGGALVVKATDPAKAKQALNKIAGLVPQITTGVKSRRATGISGLTPSTNRSLPTAAMIGNGKLAVRNSTASSAPEMPVARRDFTPVVICGTSPAILFSACLALAGSVAWTTSAPPIWVTWRRWRTARRRPSS